jgi:predicted  nucleic acid-binding Zn-ribbon protein
MSTEIERKSLEAHVELCAERYKNLDDRLQSLDSRMSRIEHLIVEVKESIAATPDKSNKVIIGIGTTILGGLIGAVITLIVHLK